MARKDQEDTGPSYSAGNLTVPGNLVEDPRRITDTMVGLKVAANYRDNRGNEGAHFISVIAFGGYAAYALDNFTKGTRIIVSGQVYGNKWGGDGGREEKHDLEIKAAWVAEDHRFYEGSGGGSKGKSPAKKRRSDDEDEAPRKKRRSDDEDEAPRGRSRRTGRRGVEER